MRKQNAPRPLGKFRWSRSRTIAGLMAGLLAFAAGIGGAVAPANATLTADWCNNNYIILVRGTGAPEGTGSVHSDRLYSYGGEGAELMTIKEVWAKGSGIPFTVLSLKYPAAGLSVTSNYLSSIAEGEQKLVAELNWIDANCAGYPGIVLMGHSQGATVVLNALASPNLTASARARVIAAAVFGDPNYATNQPINAPGAQNASSGIFGPRSFNQRLTLNSMRFWG